MEITIYPYAVRIVERKTHLVAEYHEDEGDLTTVCGAVLNGLTASKDILFPICAECKGTPAYSCEDRDCHHDDCEERRYDSYSESRYHGDGVFASNH